MQVIELEHAYDFILSGNAKFSVHNQRTGNSLAFRVWAKTFNNVTVSWYVYDQNDEYIGYIRGDIFIAAGDSQTKLPVAIKAFNIIWLQIINQSMLDSTTIYNTGQCGRCGRPLSDPDSIRVGIGPECRNKLGIKL